MQFYRRCKILYRKAVSPISILFIPQGNTRRTINLNISTVSIVLLTFFFFVNVIFLCYMIPSFIRYNNMKKQFLDYSQKVSDLNAMLSSWEKANNDLHALISPGTKENILKRVDTSVMESLEITKAQQQVASSMQTIRAVNDYLHTMKDLYLATFRRNYFEGKSDQGKRIIFNIKDTDMIKYNHIIAKASAKYNVDAALIKAIIKMESNFDHLAVSPKGAQGLMQLMPQTAQSLQVEDSFHPENNIEGGTRYLRYLLDLFADNLPLALAAYNAGRNSVIKHNNQIPPYKETQEYVQRVLDHLYSYRQIDAKTKNGKVISYNRYLSQRQIEYSTPKPSIPEKQKMSAEN